MLYKKCAKTETESGVRRERLCTNVHVTVIFLTPRATDKLHFNAWRLRKPARERESTTPWMTELWDRLSLFNILFNYTCLNGG
jgi:hypothetical protein